MPSSANNNLKLNDVDLVYQILEANGQPMDYRQLIEAVLNRMGVEADARQISAVLTSINLDTRFSYTGQGEWALKAWVPTRGVRRLPTITLLNKAVTYDDDGDKTSLDALAEEGEGPDADYDEMEEEASLDEDNEAGEEAW